MISRYLFNVNTQGSDLLSNLELVDINVLDLYIKFVMLLYDDNNSLLVITLNSRRTVKCKVDISKESHLFLYL